MQPISNSRKLLILVVVFVLLVCGGVASVFLNKKPTVVPVPQVVDTTNHPVYKVIGTSVQDRNIESYTYGTGDKHLVFIGGIHGGYEWNSVLLAYDLMDYLSKSSTTAPANLTVTVIPDANPDAVFVVTDKEGRFTEADVSTSTKVLTAARFNADNVDLNRNFDCKWQPKSTWQNKTVSAGTAAFSEPEAAAIRDYMLATKPDAAVFFHSASGGVYASQCKKGILPTALDVMNIYANAAGYPAVKTFDAYATTGAADDWLASVNIPAITVELKTHNTIEWDQNLAGIKALFDYFSLRK